LIAVIVDDADFADTDPLVDAQVFSYGAVLRDYRRRSVQEIITSGA
jgi:hypothetical protein